MKYAFLFWNTNICYNELWTDVTGIDQIYTKCCNALIQNTSVLYKLLLQHELCITLAAY